VGGRPPRGKCAAQLLSMSLMATNDPTPGPTARIRPRGSSEPRPPTGRSARKARDCEKPSRGSTRVSGDQIIHVAIVVGPGERLGDTGAVRMGFNGSGAGRSRGPSGGSDRESRRRFRTVRAPGRAGSRRPHSQTRRHRRHPAPSGPKRPKSAWNIPANLSTRAHKPGANQNLDPSFAISGRVSSKRLMRSG